MAANSEPAPSDDRRGPEVSDDASAQATTAPTAEQRADAAVEFLRLLQPCGPWVLTAIRPDGKTETRTIEDEDDARLFVRRHDGSRNLYYSVNPTKHAMFSKASKQDIAAAEFVHADLDPRDDETPEDAKARYMERLAAFEPHPTVVVDTGNGIQTLWRLEAPVPPDRFAKVEAASAGVIAALGGDPGTHNVDRILRLPGTRNLPTKAKRKRGRVECDAVLLSFDSGTHPLDAFPAAEPRAAAPRRSAEIIPLPTHLRERAARSTGRGVSADPDDMRSSVDPADVAAALAVIPADDREVWYRVGAAVYSAFEGSEEGFAIFDAWSRTTKRKNYSEDSARKQWHNSAAFTAIRAGTIFHLADEHDPRWRSAREPKKTEADFSAASETRGERQLSAHAAPKQEARKFAGLPLRAHGERQLQPARWLIRNRLPETGVALLSGQWGTGKTFTALEIAGSVMRGIHFLGEPVLRKGGVLFLAAEGAGEIPLRLAGIAEAKLLGEKQGQLALGRAAGDTEHLPFLWADTCPPLMARGTLDLLATTAADAAARLKDKFELPLSMIIVDTLAAAAGFKDENDNAEGQRAMNVLHDLSRRTGALVLALDHFGKEATTGTRGASAKEASADIVLALLGKREDSGKITGAKLVTRKVRGGPSGLEFPFRLRVVDLGVDENNFAVSTCVIEWTTSVERSSPPKRSGANGALDHAIAIALSDGSEPVEINGRAVQATRRDRVREIFAEAYGADKKPGAVRTAFNRALNETLAAGHVREGLVAGTGYLWLDTAGAI